MCSLLSLFFRWLAALACAAWILSGPLLAVGTLFAGRLEQEPAAYLPGKLGAAETPHCGESTGSRGDPLLTQAGAWRSDPNDEGPAYGSAGQAFSIKPSAFRSR